MAPIITTAVPLTLPARRKVPARLLPLSHGRCVALPAHATVEIVESWSAAEVPRAAPASLGLLAWRGSRLPLLDLQALLFDTPMAAPRYALVVVWQAVAGGPVAHGALALTVLPRMIQVGDEAQCALPDRRPVWRHVATACFQHDGMAVPVLDCRRLFQPPGQ